MTFGGGVGEGGGKYTNSSVFEIISFVLHNMCEILLGQLYDSIHVYLLALFTVSSLPIGIT